MVFVPSGCPLLQNKGMKECVILTELPATMLIKWTSLE